MSKRISSVKIEILKNLRKKAGLSQKEVADKLGVVKSHISQIENGHVAIPDGRKLIKILDVYDITPKYFEQLINDKHKEEFGRYDEEDFWENERYIASLEVDGIPKTKYKISNHNLRDELDKKYGPQSLWNICRLIEDFVICSQRYNQSLLRKKAWFSKDLKGKARVFQKMTALEVREFKKFIWFKKNKNSRDITIFFIYFLGEILKNDKGVQWPDVQKVLSYFKEDSDIAKLFKEINFSELEKPEYEDRYHGLRELNKKAKRILDKCDNQNPKTLNQTLNLKKIK